MGLMMREVNQPVKNQVSGLADSIKHSEQLLKLVVTNMHDILAIYGTDGVCQYISPSVLQVMGYDQTEVVGTTWMSYCHPYDFLRVNEHFNNAKQSQPMDLTRIECRLRRKAGNYCWLETEVSRMYDDKKHLLGFLMISRNIMARKQVEQALEGSYEQMLLALNASKTGAWGFQPAVSYGLSLRQWWELLGYADGDVSTSWRGLIRLCHPQVRKTVGGILKKYSTDDTLRTVEVKFQIRHKDDSYHCFLASGRKILDAECGCLRWTGIVVDITGLEAIEAARLESETRLRDFARAFRDVSAIIDENGKYIEVVTQNEKLLSRTSVQLKDSSLYEGGFAEKAEFIVRQIRRAIKTRHLQTCSFEYLNRGCRQFIEMRIAPMNYLAEGKKTAAVVFSWLDEAMRAEQIMEFTLLLRKRSSFMDTILRDTENGLKTKTEMDLLGIDFSVSFFCCVVELNNLKYGQGIDQFNKRQLLVMKHLSEVHGLFVWDYQGKIGILVNVDAMGAVADDIQTVQNILTMIKEYDPLLTTTAGISNRHVGFFKIGKSCRQATKALVVACQKKDKTICRFRDLGIYRVLANFNEEEATEYVEEMIGGLMKHDRCHGTDLLDTLEVILQCDNLKEAAQRLFFHYNTVVRKKHRIESILGYGLNDTETKLALITAIKLCQLMQQKS